MFCNFSELAASALSAFCRLRLTSPCASSIATSLSDFLSATSLLAAETSDTYQSGYSCFISAQTGTFWSRASMIEPSIEGGGWRSRRLRLYGGDLRIFCCIRLARCNGCRSSVGCGSAAVVAAAAGVGIRALRLYSPATPRLYWLRHFGAGASTVERPPQPSCPPVQQRPEAVHLLWPHPTTPRPYPSAADDM